MKIKQSLLLLLISNLGFSSEICKMDSDKLLSQLITNHPSIKMSQEVIKGAKERVDSAFWGYFPTPSVDVSVRDEDRNLTTARIEQPIWTGGKITSKYDIATSKEQETILELQETSYNLIENFLSILNAYMQSKANILELEEGLNNLNKFNEMLDRRMDAGISSNSDKELLNARIEQINSEMLLAKNIPNYLSVIIGLNTFLIFIIFYIYSFIKILKNKQLLYDKVLNIKYVSTIKVNNVD